MTYLNSWIVWTVQEVVCVSMCCFYIPQNCQFWLYTTVFKHFIIDLFCDCYIYKIHRKGILWTQKIVAMTCTDWICLNCFIIGDLEWCRWTYYCFDTTLMRRWKCTYRWQPSNSVHVFQYPSCTKFTIT